MPLNKPALKAPQPAAETALARAMPAAPKLAMPAGMGDSASPAALARLNKALEELAALRREAAL
ncbi:hypothetical protein ACI4A4_28415, partial [Klebsiella pneumoniae]|uniref:hypothetical protein n=1 Tax=Klebsiella pneumoniae TaxID=573 RepID=UPI003852F56F